MIKTISPRLAVFDCDGTLVDSQASIISAMVTAFEVHSCPIPESESIRRVVGLPIRVGMERLLPNKTSSEHENLEYSYKEAFGRLRRKGEINDPLYPDVCEVLDILEKDGWLLGVATGKSTRGLRMTLEKFGLINKFITLQTSDTAPGKPDPGMLINAMSEAGVNSQNTIMIGDTTFDMEMAKNARVKSIGVSWGYHPQKELNMAGASFVAKKFLMIPKLLNKIILDLS
jgi:phosphoglycolate phosphatase